MPTKRAFISTRLSALLAVSAMATFMTAVSLKDILAATGGEAQGFSGETTFTQIGIDSRTIEPGELFWAIRGPNFDGHNFTADAIRRGAAGCVVSADDRTTKTELPTIRVQDTLLALRDFAADYRTKHEAVVIGVTGSFGKTTTREMIFTVLAAAHSGMRSPKNYNNHVGVPLTLLELREHHEFAVLEFGASAQGEIAQLATIAAPEIGVITGIGPAHLDGFGSLEGVIAAKSELIEQLPSTGFAVFAGDDERVRRMAKRSACTTIFIGERTGNHLTATQIEQRTDGLRFAVDGTTYHLPVIGRHHVTAALSAIAVGKEIGLSPAVMVDALAGFQPVPGRCESRQIGTWQVIDDTYNANPSSMRAACDTLQHWPTAGRRILIAGDMRELGTQTADCHREIGQLAAAAKFDHVLAFGDFARHVAGGAMEHGLEASQLADCESFDAMLTVLDCWLQPGDIVLVKGSRSMRMERIIAWLQEQAAKEIEHTKTKEETARSYLRACA